MFAVQMQCCTDAIFLVCRTKKFEQAVQTFAALWYKFCRSTNFCCLMAQVLLPYGPVLINREQYKSQLQFFRGCKSLS